MGAIDTQDRPAFDLSRRSFLSASGRVLIASSTVIASCAHASRSEAQGAAGVMAAGIPSEAFARFYRPQEKPNWCWAASIEMVLDWARVNVNQRAIVRQVYGVGWDGQPPNNTAQYRHMVRLLNQWGIDDDGDHFVVNARGASRMPPGAWLLGEIDSGYPVLLAYRSGYLSGHIVVVTGAYYTPTPHGPTVHGLVLWDPYPYALVGQFPPPFYRVNRPEAGRFEAPVPQLAQLADFHMFTRATDDSDHRWPDY